MSLFIDVEVAPEAAADPAMAAKLAEVCPVDIYALAADGTLEIVEANLDECVLCRLCIDAAPAGHRDRPQALRRRRDPRAGIDCGARRPDASAAVRSPASS